MTARAKERERGGRSSVPDSEHGLGLSVLRRRVASAKALMKGGYGEWLPKA